MLGYFLFGLSVLASVWADECRVPIPDDDRRDCYPWPMASREACEERGCVWCGSEKPGIPWCYYDDKVCPSLISEEDRTECLPEGGMKIECTAKGCLWCETSTPGIPYCFHDDSESLGGDFCPSELDMSEGEMVDCFPETDATRSGCLAKGCYWCESSLGGAPWCFAPQQYGYRRDGEVIETTKGYEVYLVRKNYPSWLGSDVQRVLLELEFQTEARLRIKFTDPTTSRFEVPVEVDIPPEPPTSTLYDVQFVDEPAFGLKVIRSSTGATIFDTTIGGLTFSDQFLQIGTYLDSSDVYGFGEQEHHSFRHDMQWNKLGMWARDQAVTTSNLYGVQPIYMNIENSSDAHGVLFMNANAQDVILQPHPALLYRTNGGILDMYIFLGPSPENVVQQLTQAIGRPAMVPYWSLGFQLCRWGYDNIGHMKQAIARMRKYNIPHDVQYGDIDYMRDHLDFTVDDVNFPGLAQYVDELKAEGTRFVIILDPAISYTQDAGSYPTFTRGEEAQVWVMRPGGEGPVEGEVWPGPTYFPDYTNPSTMEWWTNECVLFKQDLDFAGLWIDMNEPASFDDDANEQRCANNKWNRPQFKPNILGQLYDKTVCMDSEQSAGLHYNVHSLFGWSMAKASFAAAREATGLRSVVFSRSTFPGIGRYSHHWLGDNWSRWSNMKWSIIGMMEFNMFGIPYVGSDICGFLEVPTEELCLRWQQLGAFYPFSRNHNAVGNPDQDPGMWESVANAAREALHIRYYLLPYLYTLFHLSNTIGSTVVRPLMFEFVADEVTRGIDEQFMWGSAMMVSPALAEGVRELNIYFPEARWYNYQTGAEVPRRGGYYLEDVPLERVPVHLRGGYVTPTQRAANSTLYSRTNPMGIIVALDHSAHAVGQLFWDDGETQDTYENGLFYQVEFTVNQGTLESSVTSSGYDVSSLLLDDIEVLGVATDVTSVTINGVTHSDWILDVTIGKLQIENAAISLTTDFVVTWL